MTSTTTYLTASTDAKGSSPTPKPLRISKRSITSTTSLTLGSSPSRSLAPRVISSWNVNESVLPRRTSSVSSEYPRRSIQKGSSSRSVAPSPSTSRDLIIRKQRGSEAISFIPDLDDRQALASGEHETSRPFTIYTCNRASQDSAACRPSIRRTRDLNTGVAGSSSNLNSEKYCDGSYNRRVVPHIQEHQYSSEWQGISRRSSIKNRLFNRVISGLSTKKTATTDSGDYQRNRRSMCLPINTAAEKVPCAPISRVRATTTSSIATESPWGSEFERTVATFPTPPTSAGTRSVTVDRSHGVMTPLLLVPQDLVAPEATRLLGGTLGLLSGLKSLEADKEESFFVAVEIGALVEPPTMSNRMSPISCGLDVAIIIDNSLSTSPAALTASCESARFVASILEKEVDRLAIFSSHPHSTVPNNSLILSPLSYVNTYKIKSALDDVEISNEKNRGKQLENALEMAKKTLMQSSTNPTNILRGPSVGHVFLFTSDLASVCPGSLVDDKVQVHVMTPGTLPWQLRNVAKPNGWKVSQPILDELSPLNFLPPSSNGKHFHDLLQTIISHARGGSTLGSLTDVALTIKAGPGCYIEGVMGQVEFSSLSPGELAIVLVKVKAGKTAVQASLLSKFPQRPRTPSGSIDVLEELDAMLRDTSTVILTAKLKYRHSLLPPGTQCSIKSEAKLKRHIISCGITDSIDRPKPHRIDEHQVMVQKRLIYHLATHHSPKCALSTLQAEYGEDGSAALCLEYFKLIIEELRYYATTIENSNRSNTNQEIVPVVLQGGPQQDESAPSNVLDDGDLCYTTRFEDETPSPASVIHHRTTSLTHSGSSSTFDSARKIWGELRKRSKGQSESCTVGKDALRKPSSDDTMRKKVQAVALRNKRSVGADTLHSMFNGGGEDNLGVFAPWL